MNRFYASLVLAACVTTTGCSNKLAKATTPALPIVTTAGVIVPPDNTQSTTETVQPNETTVVPISTDAFLRMRTRKVAARTTAATKNSSDMLTATDRVESAEDLRVSAVAKPVKDEDTCASSIHGHAAFLRSDLAYSVTGFDCQGDLP